MLGTIAVYAPVVGFDFVDYDDRTYLTANPPVQAGLSWATLRWAATSTTASHWHPLTMLSHALDWQVFGAWAGGHHAVSVALHAVNAVLLLALLVRTTGAPYRSAVVAALFALHPLRVESVAWVAERKDVLSGAFFLAALHCWVGWVRRPSPGRYAALLAAFVCGLLAKPMVLTFPLVALLFDRWPLGRATPLGSRLAEKLPLAALAGASALATVLAARDGAMSPLAHVPVTSRLANAVVSLRWYLQATLWPQDLGVLYLHPAAPGAVPLTTAGVVVSFVFVAAVTAWVLRAGRRLPYLVTGWGWYLAMLLPVLGLVQAGLQARADRYTYLPMIGVYVMAVWWTADALATRASGAAGRWIAGVAVGAVLAALAVRSRAQVMVWRNSETLFANAIAVEPRNFMMHFNLGTVLVEAGRLPEAIGRFEQALAIHPRYAQAQRAMGDALERVGRLEESIRHHREAVRLDPGDPGSLRLLGDALLAHGEATAAAEHYRAALAVDGDDAHTHNNLGNALLALGDEAGARAAYERAVALDPDLPGARGNLAARLEAAGEWPAALAERHAHVRLDASSADARQALAVALLHEEQADEALLALRAALRLAPDRADTRRMLAWVLATRRAGTIADGAEALALLEERGAPAGDDAMGLATLAVAQAAAGRHADAIATVERARAAATAGDATLSGVLDDMRRRFERGEPYRDAP